MKTARILLIIICAMIIWLVTTSCTVTHCPTYDGSYGMKGKQFR